MKNYKSKLERIYGDSFSSITNSDSRNSEASRFEREHHIQSIFKPDKKRDKIIISVLDTGIGIKRKDKFKLFKLFGTL